MDLPTFLHQRRSEWKRLEDLLGQIEGSGLSSLDEDQAVEFGRLYRRTASDLNQVQTFISGEAIQRYLNDLVARAYLAIYGKAKVDILRLLYYLFWDYPAVFRRYLRHLLLAAGLFATGILLGYLISWYDQEAARAYLLPPQTIRPIESNEDAALPYDADQLMAFSSYLFSHNVSVSLFAFALGITGGLGTAWMMFYNGVIMGVLAAVFVESHQWLAFATGVLPHGVLEIPACFIGGAAGFVLAQGLVRAQPWPRREELTRQGKQAVLLLFGCVPLLAVAACLEAGVARAPDWFLAKGLKLACAGVFGLLFLAYILLLGWSRSTTQINRI